MQAFFHTFFYTPIYNLLVFSTLYVPNGDVGLAIIAATLTVKTALLPLSLSATKTQKAMKRVEPHLKKIKEDHKHDKERQARETLALYKEHGIRPFASILTMFIQIPVVLALYFVFRNQALPAIDQTLLYPFVQAGTLHASLLFLGVFNLAEKSVLLALLAAASQMLMGVYTVPLPPKAENPTAADDFAHAMGVQVRFVLPLIIGFVAYTSGAIALYFITSSLFAIAQEFFVRKTHHNAL